MARRERQVREQLQRLDADTAQGAALAVGSEHPGHGMADAHGLGQHRGRSSSVANRDRWWPGLACLGYHDIHGEPFAPVGLMSSPGEELHPDIRHCPVSPEGFLGFPKVTEHRLQLAASGLGRVVDPSINGCFPPGSQWPATLRSPRFKRRRG
jgi:hypothetical protein